MRQNKVFCSESDKARSALYIMAWQVRDGMSHLADTHATW